MLGTLSEAERLFHNEVREKKRTASGVHHKTGKRGYVGKMRFPTDIMSRKDKYNYRKAGKVMTTNLFDEIITLAEFEKLDKNEQKNRLSYWRIEHSNKEILKGMGISNKKYYDIVGELDLPKAPRTPYKKRTGTTKAAAKPPEPKTEELPEPSYEEQQPDPIQQVIVDGLHVVFNGTYSAEKIEKQLTKFMLLLDGEEDEFYIEMRLIQKQSKK